MSMFDTSKALTALKKETVDEEGHKWLYDADATALVYALRHLDSAYKNFFRRIKQGTGPAGHPKFKTKRDPHPTFTVAKCEVGEDSSCCRNAAGLRPRYTARSKASWSVPR